MHKDVCPSFIYNGGKRPEYFMVRNSEVSWDMTMLFQYYAAIKTNVSEELLVTLKQLSRYIKEKAGTPETK